MQPVRMPVPNQADRPLSVIFLSPILGEGWGGVEKWMLTVGSYLGRKGHRVVAAGAAGCRWLRTCAEAGIPTRSVPIRADFHPRSIYRLRKCMAEQRTDVICVKMHKGIRLAGMTKLLLPDPRPAVICRMGDSVMQRSRRARLTYRWLVDGYITPSQQTRRDLLAYGYFGPDRIDCVPNGVELHAESPAARGRVRQEFGLDNEKFVIVNSRLHPAKGHEYLFRAIQLLAGSVPMRLLVVGNGARRSVLKSAVADMGIGDIVRFAGFRTDVGRLLQGADLAVLPSLLEGLPNNVLEAMAAGKPVVATAVDGVPEAVVDGVTGVLVPPADPQALARAMKMLLTDDALSRRMAEAGRDRARRLFSLDLMLARTEAVFLARRERRHHHYQPS